MYREGAKSERKADRRRLRELRRVRETGSQGDESRKNVQERNGKAGEAPWILHALKMAPKGEGSPEAYLRNF
jgi:hypothetical protein